MGSICTPSESNKTIVLGRYLVRPSITDTLQQPTTTHHTTTNPPRRTAPFSRTWGTSHLQLRPTYLAR
jgi:hypothetical protein